MGVSTVYFRTKAIGNFYFTEFAPGQLLLPFDFHAAKISQAAARLRRPM